MPARLIQRHDEFAKSILDEPGNADAFLRERLPPAVVDRLSDKPAMDRSASYVDPFLREKRGDRVYAIETTDGETMFVWAMVEHKSAPETDILVQTARDLTGIACRAATKRTNLDGTVWMVPAPVYPVILYHSTKRWPLPTELAQAYGLSPELTVLGLLNFIYTLINLTDIPDEALSDYPSLRAALMVLKYAQHDDAPEVVLDRLIAAAAAFDLTTAILVVRYLYKASDWLNTPRLQAALARIMPGEEEKVLSPAAQDIINEARPKIIDEARPKIEAAARADTILRLLERKFGGLDDATVQRVRDADDSQLAQMTDNILDAHTLDDVFVATRPQ